MVKMGFVVPRLPSYRCTSHIKSVILCRQHDLSIHIKDELQ